MMCEQPAIANPSELKSHDDLTRPGSAINSTVIDVAEAAGSLAIGTGLRRHRICRSRVVRFCPVEDVGELSPDLQVHALLESEVSSETHILCRAPLVSIIAVISGGAAVLACRRIDPRGGVQHKRLVWIEAVAVKILSEKRHSRNPVHQRVLERVSGKIGGGLRRQDGQSAAVAQKRADLPVPRQQ